MPTNTGIVLRQNNNVADALYQVPLFYPSYTREAATIAADNMMVAVVKGGRQYLEVNKEGKQKFILTNVHWTYNSNSGWGPKITETDAAGFYRLHVWGDEEKDFLPDNCAYLGVPEGELPIAVWNTAAGTSREGTLGIREETDTGLTPVSSPRGEGDLEGAPFNDQRSSTSEAANPSAMFNLSWYTLDGMRLSKRPVKPGLYIHHGHKVVVP